jgi:hypothetical protein
MSSQQQPSPVEDKYHQQQQSPVEEKHHQQQPASRTTSYSAAMAPMEQPALLAATGKKRKRLQRACRACHDAKRRCSGGIPCSNCDFSGRMCSYSDAHGNTVTPTKRTLMPSEAALQEQQKQYMKSSASSSTYPHQGMPGYAPVYRSTSSAHSQQSSPSMTHQDMLNNTNEAPRLRLEPSLESRRELLSIFFSRLSPLSSVFDEISFLRDLSSMEVSPVLLYAMYAVSAGHAYEAHHQQGPNGNAKYSKLVAEAGNGSKYIKEARRLLCYEDEHIGESLMDGRPNLEAAQALYLLAFYEFNQGRYFRASSYVQLSSKHVISLSLETDVASHSRDSNDDSSLRALQRRNIRRLICLVTAMDVSISMMNGQSISTKQWNIQAAIDSSTLVEDNDDDEESVAMTQLLHISLLLNTALELTQRSSVQPLDKTAKHAAQCQVDLHRWAERLPRYLQFDETRLTHVEQVLNERINRPRSPTTNTQMNKGSAVCWTMMHSMAETTTLLLQELGSMPERSPKLAACRNLFLLLEQSNPSSLPRLFASFSVAVLYSVSSTIADHSQDREWARIWDRARSFAVYVGLGESVWTSMANWWRRRRAISMSPQRSPTSANSDRRLPLASSPSLQSMTTASSHRSSIRTTTIISLPSPTLPRLLPHSHPSVCLCLPKSPLDTSGTSHSEQP